MSTLVERPCLPPVSITSGQIDIPQMPPCLEPGQVIETAGSGTYRIEHSLKSGMRGQTYLATVLLKLRPQWPVPRSLKSGSRVVVKMPLIENQDAADAVEFVKRVNSTLVTEF